MAPKSYPSHISISQLAELSGRDRRTVTDRLKNLTPIEEDGVAKLYEIRAAIRLCFDFNPEDDPGVEFAGTFQPIHEKAKLDFFKRQAIELDVEERKRNLIPREEIANALAGVFGSLRSKLLGLPAKATQQISGLDQKQTEALLRKIIDEALVDLSETRVIDERTD